jgi:hypothetical protein
MSRVISVRVPADWKGRVDSERAHVWITEWLQKPVSFNGIPKPGTYKINIRLTDTEIARLRKARRGTQSSTIRGILGLRISEAQKNNSGGWGTIFQFGLVLLSLFATSHSGVGHPGGQKPGES